MSIKITSNISVADIPSLLQNDYSIYREKIAPIISSSEYTRWVLTEGVQAVVARDNKEIIGQMWAHPIEIYQNYELIKKRFFWIHNIKIHPNWQNKGIFKQIVDFYLTKVFSENDHCLFLINTSNKRMRFLARKLKLFPVLNVSGVILFRYFVSLGTTKFPPLKIVKSHIAPKFWLNHALKHKKFWIPHFSWDTSPEWVSFYFRNQPICTFQITRPIHQTQGRFIHKFPILFHSLQIRYFSILPDILKLHPSITRSIFTSMFHAFPQIDTLVFTLNPRILSKLLHIPRFAFPSRKFILFSTIKDSELIQNNLDFHPSFILLDNE
ncbi:MAG: GNAT family N-acetyltransferase [Candidatus Hodarchaeota archaeon]